MLVAPSDHVIDDHAAFHAAIDTGATAAERGHLVTFGITPAHAETGYGYIHRGAKIANAPGTFKVSRFVEKPDRLTAERLLADGNYFWNSGMFLFSPASYVEELSAHAPWASDFPVNDLIRHNLINKASKPAGKVAELLAYFRVSTPEAWAQQWLVPRASFRASPAYKSSPQAAVRESNASVVSAKARRRFFEAHAPRACVRCGDCFRFIKSAL